MNRDLKERRELSRNWRRGNIPSGGNNTGKVLEVRVRLACETKSKNSHRGVSEVGDEERDKIDWDHISHGQII